MDIEHVKSIRKAIRAVVKSRGPRKARRKGPPKLGRYQLNNRDLQYDMRPQNTNAQRPLERLHQEVSEQLEGEDPHVVLRLKGEDRVYHQTHEPSAKIHDRYVDDSHVEPVGHGQHPGGFVHVSFPEDVHSGTHQQQYEGGDQIPGVHTSQFHHLGRIINERYYPGNYPGSPGRHRIFWDYDHPPTGPYGGTHMIINSYFGANEREARSEANDMYHHWHAVQQAEQHTG